MDGLSAEIAVPPQLIPAQAPLPCDLYVLFNDHKVRFKKSGDSLTEEQIQKLTDKGIGTLYLQKKSVVDLIPFILEAEHSRIELNTSTDTVATILRTRLSHLIELVATLSPDDLRALLHRHKNQSSTQLSCLTLSLLKMVSIDDRIETETALLCSLLINPDRPEGFNPALEAIHATKKLSNRRHLPAKVFRFMLDHMERGLPDSAGRGVGYPQKKSILELSPASQVLNLSVFLMEKANGDLDGLMNSAPLDLQVALEPLFPPNLVSAVQTIFGAHSS